MIAIFILAMFTIVPITVAMYRLYKYNPKQDNSYLLIAFVVVCYLLYTNYLYFNK